MYQEVQDHLKEYHSSWASPVMLVWKKDGELWFCIGLQKLNARMVKVPYGLPRIEGTLDCLNSVVWFTALDPKAGYWQVKMDETSNPLMALTVSLLRFYEHCIMPFSLMNVPATVQRLMEICFGELQLNWCLIHLNDIIVFSKTPKKHLSQFRAVFQTFKEVGLKLKPSKYEFFKNWLTYQGHKILERVIKTNYHKVREIWPTPKTVTEVRSF